LQDSVVLQTTSYERFEGFAEKLSHAVRTVLTNTEHDQLGVVQRVGLRYFSLAKEPVVEVLRAKKVDKQQSSGRNPRTLQLAVDHGDQAVVLSLSVHERWFVPRDLLLQEAPARNPKRTPSDSSKARTSS
jgi:uncharacterized protein (TIGR04255 family)